MRIQSLKQVLAIWLVQGTGLASLWADSVIDSTADVVADDGVTTLREAVAAGGEITFSPAVFSTPQTVGLTSQLEIPVGMEIIGLPGGLVTISRGDYPLPRRGDVFVTGHGTVFRDLRFEVESIQCYFSTTFVGCEIVGGTTEVGNTIRGCYSTAALFLAGRSSVDMGRLPFSMIA